MITVPPPASALEVLLLLEQIDADRAGEKTRRKLELLEAQARLVRDHALAEVTLGLRRSGESFH